MSNTFTFYWKLLKQKDDILRTIEEETGKGIEEISTEKGRVRQITMELLYRLGGLRGINIGKIMGVGYTSVRQERRRLRGRKILEYSNQRCLPICKAIINENPSHL